MHELSFATEVLDAVEREAAPYAGCRVVKVRLYAESKLNVDASSLVFCLEAISAGTVMAGAEIEVRQGDGADVAWQGPGGSSGTDLIIEEIELDAPDDQA